MEAPQPSPTLATLTEPIREGVVDLRRAVRSEPPSSVQVGGPVSIQGFAAKYKLFFAFLFIVIAALLLTSVFLGRALNADHSFKVQETVSEQESVQK